MKTKVGKKIIFILNVKPYHRDCIVACNAQMDDILKWMKKLPRKNHNADETIKYIENNKDKYFDIIKPNCGRLYVDLPFGGYILIVNHSNYDWLDTASNVSHESTHLSHYILRDSGIELTKETEEAYTYLQAQILKDILRKIY